MQKNQPIGVFDSGIGGLTVLKSLQELMPQENFVYLGDNKNAPYGNKASEEIINLSNKCTEFLISKSAKIIVVACNTATGTAIKFLREKYSELEFIGLEPAIKPACLATKTKNIGVLATQRTFASKHYKTTSNEYGKFAQIHAQIGHQLVNIAEENKIETKEAKELLQEYIKPLIEKNIDYLVLGCTHYPFFNKQIKEICGPKINVIDSGEAVSRRTQEILAKSSLLNQNKTRGNCSVYTTGNKDLMQVAWSNLNHNADNYCTYSDVCID